MIGDLEDMSGERLDHDRGARKDKGGRTAALLRRPVRPSIEEFADGGVPVWSSGCSAMASLPPGVARLISTVVCHGRKASSY